uniref:Embigin n=1 Tax=Tetraodon nigroviridis TaxID=99883 RepID=H3DDQ8_TETNG
MVASRTQPSFHLVLLLLCCRPTKTKSPEPSAPPQLSDSPLPTVSKKVVLTGESHTEKVEVVGPVILELECSWAGNPDTRPNVTGFWSKDGIEIEDSRFTVPREKEHYNLQRKLNISTRENLGNYSCVFGGDAKMDFVLAAPQMGEVRDKPIVSYVGDKATILCKMEESKPQPTSWIWYKANGTEKEQILEAAVPQKYEIKNQERETKLLVYNLTEADSGLYYCNAVYPMSSTEGQVVLRVITFHEPLKPFFAIAVEDTGRK